MRILVIDDNPDDRQLEMREVFSLYPQAEVVELTNLADFDAALEAGVPDLVLTDLDLRWGSGRDVLAQVKARYPACPVVMFTGTGNETIAVDLMKAGLDDYVVKSPKQLPRLRTSLKIAVEMADSRAALSDRELSLTRALAQQQTIVRELHHRVKNNLQTMSGLLKLRSRMVDLATRDHMEEIAGRLHALGAVQSRIYDTQSLDRVDFRAALDDIAASLIGVHKLGQVILKNDIGSLELDIARAMPLSLLCYEVILNTMKHAWPDGNGGTLTLASSGDGTKVELRISDDGVGFTDGAVTPGLGSRLMLSLATEAGATIVTKSQPLQGTHISVTVL